MSFPVLSARSAEMPPRWFASSRGLLPVVLALASVAGLVPDAARADSPRQVMIQRTANGVAHVQAADLESLAYGVAYAHTQDNLCQTAQLLATVRGERSRFFGPKAVGMLGLRQMPNEQIDAFVASAIDDAALDAAWTGASAASQALARGWVAGFNRQLADRRSLPPECADPAWVRAMTLADFRRTAEMSGIQAGLGALADAMLAARPPAPVAPSAASAPAAAIDDPASAVVASADEIRAAFRERGLVDSPYGSNAWAFGSEVTADGGGLLLGNPHFPWVGPNRFWQMHLTVPGQFDVMGAAIGLSGVVQIGFNRDVAWSHTVSTGKRFTLYELALVPGDATAYLVDGKVEKMTARTARYTVRGDDGKPAERSATTWSTRWGPVVVLQRAGLNWTDKLAYALKDANTGNVRGTDTWLAFARATKVEEMRAGLANLGLPWVNTIAADRHGHALYADVSVVPDVDAARLARCAPGKAAAGLLNTAGIAVLDGSRSDCDWHRDPASPVAGLTPIARMPVAIRSDWVHNSNDSFFYTHPGHVFGAISPLVGDDVVRRARTRSGLIEIPEMIAAGKLTPAALQAELFADRNLMGRLIVPDLLAACANAPSAEARDGCEALRGWDQRSDLGSRGAHLFREFWRAAAAIPGVYRQPFDRARPVETPTGLKLADPETAAKIWDALAAAVKKVRAAGFALNDPLGKVQQAVFATEDIPLHGGDEIEGTLNNLGDRMAPGISAKGLRIDYGSSYIQTVRFDDRGPVAQAILTYGQSSDPASPHRSDQLKLFSAKTWPKLPFHPADVEKARVGEVVTLVLP